MATENNPFRDNVSMKIYNLIGNVHGFAGVMFAEGTGYT